MTLELGLVIGAVLGGGIAVTSAAAAWGERHQRPLLSTTGATALVVGLTCTMTFCLLKAWTVGR
ncbi:hypothetical protein C9F11_37440 [Streptomyces sp. YIM 121038]|uniref:hypothetical protein n=1 Tax=Streptomyces sp. YIM 121038 TaxID=2136401 RepID=UPI001110D129|nr:hypothetical protein [Streptomyces sp. YIM 121038]QCX81071.1 hypothetical protein C9F11_37440 [Streptomyces sp. YIM 121038]